MTKVYSPNKNYSGISANVKFQDGVGETDRPQVIEWFREHGYTIEESTGVKVEKTELETIEETPMIESTEPEPESEPELSEIEMEIETIEDLEQIPLDDIDKTDADQLRAYAKQEGIELGMSTSARGILQKITAAKRQEV